MNKILKTAGVILMSFFLTFGATPTKATDSVSGYITRYTVNTAGRSDWTGSDGTSVSSTAIERNGNNVISFSSGKGSTSLSASTKVSSMPTIEFDITTLTFKLLLYIDDISAIKDRSGNFLGGEIGFYGTKVYTVTSEDSTDENSESDESSENTENSAESQPETVFAEEPVYYTWDLSDISLKQGWNRLTLNFKTADTDNVVNAFTFEDITEFRVTVNKNNSANLTVAFDNAEICVLSISEGGEVIEPITDTQTTKELAIAAGIAAAVVGGISAACFIMAKKDEKRRLRERKAKALARKQQNKSDTE